MKKRILIVDDSPQMRFAIRSVLAFQSGVEICGEAADGADGIEQAERLNPDLILMDLSMPRLNGAEAASVLKRRLPHVPVLLFTMYDTFMGKSLSEHVGLRGVVSKAEGLAGLMRNIYEIIAPSPQN